MSDERLKPKAEGFTRLTYTGLCGELEHLKIETRLIDQRGPSPKEPDPSHSRDNHPIRIRLLLLFDVPTSLTPVTLCFHFVGCVTEVSNLIKCINLKYMSGDILLLRL
jgi:hypothetical protein